MKFHVQKPQITYLVFPEFDKEPHPTLKTSMAIALQDLYVRYATTTLTTRLCSTKKTRL